MINEIKITAPSGASVGTSLPAILPEGSPPAAQDLVEAGQQLLERQIDPNVRHLILLRENAIYPDQKLKAIDMMMKYTKRMRPDSVDIDRGGVNVNVFVQMLTGKP